jgi:hypothetical protein
MHVSRRIYCNAANAFRPAAALKIVFSESIAPQRSFTTRTNQQDKVGVLYNDVFRQGLKTSKRHLDLDGASEVAKAPSDAEPKDDGLTLQTAGAIPRADAQSSSRPDIHRVNGDAIGAELLDDAFMRRLGDKSDETAYEGNAVFQSPKLADIARKKIEGQQQEALEYKGQYVEPTIGRISFQSKNLPWMRELGPNNEALRMRRYIVLRIR